MAGQRDCDSVVTAGRLSKATEFFELAELGEDTHPNAAGEHWRRGTRTGTVRVQRGR